jgi:hypothetical protein
VTASHCCALHAAWAYVCSELQFVVANASKLPGLTKALPAFKGELLAVVYWGSTSEQHVQVRVRVQMHLPSRVQVQQLPLAWPIAC